MGEAAGLSVLDGREVLYLDQVDSDQPVQVRDWTGERICAHTGSSGLVLLAAALEADRERYLAEPLVGMTPRTTTDPAVLRRRLVEVAADGYAWTHGEYVEGISSVAAPLVGAGGQVVAAIHAHGPSYRFPAPGTADEVTDRVVEAARRISARLAPQLDVAVP